MWNIFQTHFYDFSPQKSQIYNGTARKLNSFTKSDPTI